MTYDPELNRVYIGTGNGYPWNQKIRDPEGGDNLFLCSIVALDADTGEYIWHYQVNPGETWDYNAVMDMVLADLEIGGKQRKVLMQAPKNGFFYVLDRETGELLSADAHAKVTWASKIDLKTGRPVEMPNARYTEGPFELWPGTHGAHSWLPMAYSPKTKLVYLPQLEDANILSDPPNLKDWKPPKLSTPDAGVMGDFNPDLPGAGQSALVAWDPVNKRPAWRVPTPSSWPGGAMATSGNLVFQGQVDGAFNAYDAETGKRLWSFDAHGPVVAPPITYRAGGKQYVTVLTGSGTSGTLYARTQQQFNQRFETPRRILTFALDGKGKLPPTPPPAPLQAPPDPGFTPNPAQVQAGSNRFAQNCGVCHGFLAIGAGHAPDLRTSSIPLDANAFKTVVHDGALVSAGMPQFEEFSDTELAELRQYLRSRAKDLREGK